MGETKCKNSFQKYLNAIGMNVFDIPDNIDTCVASTYINSDLDMWNKIKTKYDNVSHYRLDKMTDVQILDEKVKPQKEIRDFKNGFSLPKHMAEHIYMFSGESERVKLLAPATMMDELIDWLGKDFTVRKTDDEDEIEITLNCNVDSMFYWALQYGPYVEILEPIDLRNRIAKAVQDMADKYKEV